MVFWQTRESSHTESVSIPKMPLTTSNNSSKASAASTTQPIVRKSAHRIAAKR
nr:MAG TPA: hypothetical protein [Caudoviricetes sp.]